MPERKSVLITFGSPSDVNAVPDFERKDDTEYFLSVGSAHRTPDIVKCHAISRKWDAVVAGAGLCNALKDAYLGAVDLSTLLVALPMTDLRTGGLSSILSSSEMPPGYPVAMARMGDLPAAVRLVNFALARDYDVVDLHTDGSDEAAKVIDKANATLRDLGVGTVYSSEVNADSLNLFAYSFLAGRYEFDAFSNAHPICCYATPIMPLQSADLDKDDEGFRKLSFYLRKIKSNPDVVHTGVADGGNLGLYAAKIVARHDGDVRGRIERNLSRGREKYADWTNVRNLL